MLARAIKLLAENGDVIRIRPTGKFEDKRPTRKQVFSTR